MSRVITFSRQFPRHHPKHGQETYFVEQIYNGLPATTINFQKKNGLFFRMICENNTYRTPTEKLKFYDSLKVGISARERNVKHHTIRAGHYWKVGDKFSPRVWSDKPYRSKQITIAPDIEIKNVWDFKIFQARSELILEIKNFSKGNRFIQHTFFDSAGVPFIKKIANNDGLEVQDFYDWFVLSPEFRKRRLFDGQAICWSDIVDYFPGKVSKVKE